VEIPLLLILDTSLYH